MTELLTPPRPNRFLDARKLEYWLSNNHPDILDKWACKVKGRKGLWNWMEERQMETLDEFKEWYKQSEKQQRWNKVMEALSNLYESFYYKQRHLIDEALVEKLLTAYDKWLD